MTDTPPSLVSILSAQVTLTGATLAPGNVSLFSGSTTVELTRLQTDIAYIATAANIPAGNYTSVTLTFANPKLTIENDMTTAIAGCAVRFASARSFRPRHLCPTTVPLTSVHDRFLQHRGALDRRQSGQFAYAQSLGADFSAGTTVTPFTPAGIGAPPVGAEDVVGQVGNINASSNTFTLTNATASYTLKVDNTSTFFQFPGNVVLHGGVRAACKTIRFSAWISASNPTDRFWRGTFSLRMPTAATRKSRA